MRAWVLSDAPEAYTLSSLVASSPGEVGGVWESRGEMSVQNMCLIRSNKKNAVFVLKCKFKRWPDANRHQFQTRCHAGGEGNITGGVHRGYSQRRSVQTWQRRF
jgi:hypothetical protein